MMREFLSIGIKKATNGNSISSKTLKLLSADISADVLQTFFNDMLATGNFPDNMKLADITPVFKSQDRFKKESYNLESVLSAISRAFEKIIQNQIVGHIENFFSPYLCGYRLKVLVHRKRC